MPLQTTTNNPTYALPVIIVVVPGTNPKFLPIVNHILLIHSTTPVNLFCLYIPYRTATTPPVAPAMPIYVMMERRERERRPLPAWDWLRGRDVVGESAARVMVVHRFGTGPTWNQTERDSKYHAVCMDQC
jgi:hypothetical protein